MAEFDHAIEPEKMVEDVIGTLVTENEDSSNAGKDVEEESKALLGESKSEQERSAGIVIRWSHRGYGFVRPDDGGDDVFVHFSSIQDGNALKLDSKVEFLKVYDDRKGKYRGENVTGGFEDAPREQRSFGSFENGHSRGVCFDWQKGRCTRGASCRFAHGGEGGRSESGNTFRSSGNRSRGVCYDWQKGACTRGASCRFAHDGDDGRESRSDRTFKNFGAGRRSKGVCFDWQDGVCNRGSSCRFSHEADAKFEGATPANYAPLPVGGFGVGYTSEAPVPTMVPHDAMYGGHGAQW